MPAAAAKAGKDLRPNEAGRRREPQRRQHHQQPGHRQGGEERQGQEAQAHLLRVLRVRRRGQTEAPAEPHPASAGRQRSVRAARGRRVDARSRAHHRAQRPAHTQDQGPRRARRGRRGHAPKPQPEPPGFAPAGHRRSHAREAAAEAKKTEAGGDKSKPTDGPDGGAGILAGLAVKTGGASGGSLTRGASSLALGAMMAAFTPRDESSALVALNSGGLGPRCSRRRRGARKRFRGRASEPSGDGSRRPRGARRRTASSAPSGGWRPPRPTTR